MLEKEYNYEYVSRKKMLMSSLKKYSAYDRTRLGLPLTIDEMSKYATLLGAGEPVDIEKIIVKSL